MKIRELNHFERKAVNFAQRTVGVKLFEKRLIENYEDAVKEAVELYKEDIDNDPWYQQLHGG